VVQPPSAEVNTLSLAGDPSQELHRAEERLKPELVIVGSHGKGLLRGALPEKNLSQNLREEKKKTRH